MRWTKVVALAAVGTVAVAGCGGGSANTKSTASNSALGDTFEKVPASAGLQPDVKGPAAEVAGATKGGTLTFNVNSVPESTDPSVQYYQDTAAIMRLTNRTLTQFKMQGNKSVLVPDMATDLGSVSKDGLTWSFTLKPNLKYEDGTAIKASDIKYSVERSFAVDELPGGPTYQIDYFKGGDTYKGPWQSKGGLDSIKADDATGTISFTMRKKFASFPYFASFTMFGGIPQAKDTKTNYQLHWISSGPYKIQSYNKGTNLTLVKNTNWDASSDPARHQYPDTITFNFGKDIPTTAKSIMASNGTDATTASYDGVDASILQQALGSNKNQVATGASPCVAWQTLDTQKIPLEVRKAIAVAYPYDQLRIAGAVTQFDYSPASTIAAPQIPGFEKYVDPMFPGKGKGDPAKAKQMLAAAGKTGFELSYYYTNDDPTAQNVEAVRKPLLEAAGFKVKSIGVSKTERRKKVRDPKAEVNMGQGVSGGWCYDWPAGDSVYPPLFNSTLPLNGGVGNLKDKALDNEMSDISQLPLEQQGAKWTALDKKILTTMVPAIPTNYSKGSVIFGTKVHNTVVDPNSGMPDITGMWVG
ncbi:ABC transporter substrate-binding protein [Rudaeicoccus suwonensis]|uniref:Peptide/nickel transport system substrate-binding protein n=1 Tax=Rudaeicoccus suwonensis TaxID=657409 RepID=A0A561EA53_9MICO|nr:ABC transporter substrate-binding protein [Rudaeicoccus suwonensis]TWE12504.1 peptide/nickel transport system substrate-binding protein [Rudaeicoccus suwonensis]